LALDTSGAMQAVTLHKIRVGVLLIRHTVEITFVIAVKPVPVVAVIAVPEQAHLIVETDIATRTKALAIVTRIAEQHQQAVRLIRTTIIPVVLRAVIQRVHKDVPFSIIQGALLAVTIQISSVVQTLLTTIKQIPILVAQLPVVMAVITMQADARLNAQASKTVVVMDGFTTKCPDHVCVKGLPVLTRTPVARVL
jgi:hypothetical protein